MQDGRRACHVSDIEAEVHHVAILNDVILALGPHFPGLLGAGLATRGHIVFKGDRFSPDKSLFEIAMDNAGCLRCRHALSDGPGPGFLWSGGKIGLQPQERVT